MPQPMDTFRGSIRLSRIMNQRVWAGMVRRRDTLTALVVMTIEQTTEKMKSVASFFIAALHKNLFLSSHASASRERLRLRPTGHAESSFTLILHLLV
jgi:hypothetical protein